MIRVGIIGLGGMGNIHLGAYKEVDDAEVVALADIEEERLRPGASSEAINISEGGAVIDPDRHSLYSDPAQLLADPEVEMVDICLPTYLHAEYCLKALEAGRHVLCEKPMALSPSECEQVLEALEEAEGQLMVAQCLRFWPAYLHLKETVESGRLGTLRALQMWRGGPPPEWSWDGWILDSARSGGAVLDLHVHDADFAHYLLGRPRAVCSSGALGPSGGYDAVDTLYLYEDPLSVHAGADMALPRAQGFEMRYAAGFQKGAITFNSNKTPAVMEFTDQGRTHPEIKHADAWREEIDYFVRCLQNNEMPAVCTPQSAAFSVRLVAAEVQSIESGGVVELQ